MVWPAYLCLGICRSVCPVRAHSLVASAAYPKSRAARRDVFHPDEPTGPVGPPRRRGRGTGRRHGRADRRHDRRPGPERGEQVHHLVADDPDAAAALGDPGPERPPAGLRVRRGRAVLQQLQQRQRAAVLRLGPAAGELQPDRPEHGQRHRGHRGLQVLGARRARPARHHPRGGERHPAPAGPGRLHHRPAVREERSAAVRGGGRQHPGRRRPRTRTRSAASSTSCGWPSVSSTTTPSRRSWPVT